jgi:hypothetical protein
VSRPVCPDPDRARTTADVAVPSGVEMVVFPAVVVVVIIIIIIIVMYLFCFIPFEQID